MIFGLIVDRGTIVPSGLIEGDALAVGLTLGIGVGVAVGVLLGLGVGVAEDVAVGVGETGGVIGVGVGEGVDVAGELTGVGVGEELGGVTGPVAGYPDRLFANTEPAVGKINTKIASKAIAARLFNLLSDTFCM